MRLSDFISLSEEEKKMAILHIGVLVAKRTHLGQTVFLFHVGNYYIEAYCNRKNKAIEQYSVFESTKLLTPYLDSIPIEDLLN